MRSCHGEPNLHAWRCPPDRYFDEYEGTVHAVDRNYDASEKIGEFKVIKLDLDSVCNEQESAFDLFDISERTFGYLSLYDEHGGFSPAVKRVLFGDFAMFDPNLLILERLVIHPPWRGRCYGLAALVGMIELFRYGTGLIAMKPFPLQFEGGPPAGKSPEELTAKGVAGFAGDFRAARAKLKQYYGRVGFKQVPRTDYMVRNPATPLPNKWQRGEP